MSITAQKGGMEAERKHTAIVFYFSACDVVANFSRVHPSTHVGTLHFMKRADILACESQGKEKHSSEVSL